MWTSESKTVREKSESEKLKIMFQSGDMSCLVPACPSRVAKIDLSKNGQELQIGPNFQTVLFACLKNKYFGYKCRTNISKVNLSTSQL